MGKARQVVSTRTEDGNDTDFTYDGSGEHGFWECWGCHQGSSGYLADAKAHAAQCAR